MTLASDPDRPLGLPPLPSLSAAFDGPHALGMTLARVWAIRSRDPILRSGAAALRDGRVLAMASDGMPPGVRDTLARRRDATSREQMLCRAPAALVAAAARNGISLAGSSVYVWPLLDRAISAALLIAAGCREIVTLDVPYPRRMESDVAAMRQMAAEAGVLLSEVDPPPSIETQSGLGTFGEQPDSLS